MKDDTQPYLDFVRPYYGLEDEAHGFRHIERIVARLEMLKEGLPAPRPHFLVFLATFHGLWVLWREDPEFRQTACRFLTATGWTDLEIVEAATSLQRHLNDPRSPEENIVHDSNYIELLGAFGIAKAFTVGGARGQTYEQTVDIFEHRYLDKVEFRTPVGRRLAKEGRSYAKAFLARLRGEW